MSILDSTTSKVVGLFPVIIISHIAAGFANKFLVGNRKKAKGYKRPVGIRPKYPNGRPF